MQDLIEFLCDFEEAGEMLSKTILAVRDWIFPEKICGMM